MIAYGVIAGLMGVVYTGAIVFGELKRGKKSPQTAPSHAETKQRGHEGSGRDTSEERSFS